MKPILTEKQYAEAGGIICPYCKSNSIEGGKAEFEGDTVYANVTCLDCEKEWTDQFTLTGYLEIE